MKILNTIYNSSNGESRIEEIEGEEIPPTTQEPTLEEKVKSLEVETLNLLSTDLDFDFRLMEIETTIGQPINLNRSRGVKTMARTPYEMMKILILNGEYDKEDMSNKINVYHERGRITLEQKNELLGLIEANDLI